MELKLHKKWHDKFEGYFFESYFFKGYFDQIDWPHNQPSMVEKEFTNRFQMSMDLKSSTKVTYHSVF